MTGIDHVIYLVDDLDAAAARFRDDYGLIALPGGVFEDGLANRVVPLAPPRYLELLGINDLDVATRLQPPELALIRSGGGWTGWAIVPEDIDEVAARTGIDPVPGSIQDDQGVTTGSWRYVLPPDEMNGAVPFYVAYDEPPGSRLLKWQERLAQAAHPCGAVDLAWIEMGVEGDWLRRWIGDLPLPIRITSGEPGIRAVGLRTAGGELVIR